MGKRVKIWSRVERVVALCVGLGIVLAGCAGQKPETGNRKPEVNKVEIPSPEDFTTVGKPTKTIQTPNGPVEIYDPTQDPEVRAAFEKIYTSGTITYGDISDYSGLMPTTAPKSLKYEVTTVRSARKIHRMDLLRTGCIIIEMIPCQSFGAPYFETQCGLKNIGSDKLSYCEKENLRTNSEIVTWPYKKITPAISGRKYLTRQEVLKGLYGLVGSDQCPFYGSTINIDWRSYIGEQSGHNLQQSFSYATRFRCAKWHTKTSGDTNSHERKKP